MADRVIKVFFGSDGLPYQDKERSVHFPVLGNAFMGASNTTKLWFYCDQIGGGRKNAVVYGKLPNGKKGLTILGSYTEDSQLGENYYAFSLTSFYTQCKGDLMLSLGEYNGNIIEQEEDTLYELVGNTIVEMTGVIKLNISYAVVSDPSDEQIDNWQELLGALGDKADKNRVIITYATESALNSDFANYDNGQYYYCEETQSIYKNDDGTLEVVIENYSKQEIDTLLNDKVSKSHQPSKLYCTDNTSTDTNIPYGEEVAPYIIPKRDSAGNIKVPTTPTSNNDSASKSYVDTQRDTRVAKVSSGYKLYGTDELGNQITLPYDEDTEGKVVRRDENGHIYVQNPNANGQATPKQYVDNALSLKADKSDTYTKSEVDSIASSVKKDAYILVSTTTYPTLQDFLDDYTGQEEGNIYLYPMEDITGYYRYIWEKVDGNYEWVDLGTTDIDLSGYQKKLTAGGNIVISANDTISVNQNPTFNDVSANELRVDNTLYQLYVESISNDKVGMAYVNGNLSSDIRIYQGIPEITNESSNYKLSARFGTDDIDIEVKDYNNDTTETISLLETLDEKQDLLTTASVADGALTSFIGFDANGLVKKGTPSPITVDSQVTQGSNNPVSSNAVYDYAYPTTNPSGYQANVLESISINGTTITIVGKNVDLPAYPTKTSLGLDNVVNVGLDNVPTQYSGNGVKSGGVYNAIEDVAEVAEGKTRNYVISDSAVSGYVNDSFNSTNNTITLTISGNKIKDIENNDIDLSALKIGDIVSITETDVPDRWVGSISGGNIVFYKLETKIDVASSVQSGNANPVSSAGVYNYAQPIIDSTHKLASDLVDDNNQSNKFVSSSEKENITKNLYHLGAFDTVDTSNADYDLITRKTYYAKVNDLLSTMSIVLSAYSGACTQCCVDLTGKGFVENNNFVSNILIKDDSWVSTLYHAKVSSNKWLYFNIPTQTSNTNAIAYVSQLGIVLELEMSTSYTEKVIKNQPLNTLDQEGSQWVRNEWEKTLNLLNPNNIARANGYYSSTPNWHSNTDLDVYGVKLKAGTYTLSSTNQSFGASVCLIDNSGIATSSIVGWNSQSGSGVSFALTSDSYIGISLYKTEINTIMLNEGSVAEPYQPYMGTMIPCITDRQGRPRFLQGQITTQKSGVNLTYGKWSLSGSHLSLLVAGTIDSGTTLDDGEDIFITVNLPNWVFNKVIPTRANYCIPKTFIFNMNDWSNSNQNFWLYKSDNSLRYRKYAGSTTFNQTAYFRMEYDLLIDTD